MRPVITWVQHSGIIEIDFDSQITTELVEYYIGNDPRRFDEIVDDNIFSAAIQVAKACGYGSVVFHGSAVSFTGRLLEWTNVEKVSRIFALWAKLPGFEIREEAYAEVDPDWANRSSVASEFPETNPTSTGMTCSLTDDELMDWYDSTPEGELYLMKTLNL